MKQLIIFIGAIFFLAGCAGNPSRIAVLQNPQTKQTVECRVNPLGSPNFQIQVDNCISSYKKAGYVLVADSDDNQPATK